MNEYVTKYD